MRINRILVGMALLLMAFAMCGSFVYAQEKEKPVTTEETAKAEAKETAAEEAKEPAIKPTCDFSMTFFSKYVWRGYELSKGSMVMFPNVTVGLDAGKYGAFGINMWGDYDMKYKGAGDQHDTATWWETDWVLTYANSIPFSEDSSLDCTFGWINYDVDGAEDQELFFIFGLTNPQINKIVSPSISIWRGVMYDPAATYINLSFAHSFAMDSLSPKTKGWSVDLATTFGHYNIPSSEPGADYSAWHDGFISGGLTIPVNDWCSLAPSINYSFPLTDKADNFLKAVSFDGNSSRFVYGGVAFKMSF